MITGQKFEGTLKSLNFVGLKFTDVIFYWKVGASLRFEVQ